MRNRTPLLAALIPLLLVACATSPGPVGSPVTTPGPTIAPIQSATPAGPSATPVPSVAATPAPSVEPPTPSQTPFDYLAAEQRLLDALRADARIGCAPRRSGLPDHAIAGIECQIGSALVDRVGVYGFDGSLDANGNEVGTALQAYLARLDAAGIKPRSGDCAAGTAGDRAWPTNVGDVGEAGGGSLRAERSGCFRDGTGIANVRLTCYDDIYIGVLGTGRDIAPLYAWAWKVAPGDSVDRDPPGLCAAPD
jgi:hypothetical protein